MILNEIVCRHERFLKFFFETKSLKPDWSMPASFQSLPHETCAFLGHGLENNGNKPDRGLKVKRPNPSLTTCYELDQRIAILVYRI